MATNKFITARDDQRYNLLGNRGHPDNITVSWSNILAVTISAKLNILSAHNTNTDIILSTNKWIDSIADRLAPSDVFMIIGWNTPLESESETLIHDFHVLLQSINIRHLFFNTYHYPMDYEYYIDISYIDYVKQCYETVLMSNEYYGKEAHSSWAKKILRYIVKKRML